MYKNNNLTGKSSYTNPSLAVKPNIKPPEKVHPTTSTVLHNCNEGRFEQPYRESTDNYTTIIKKDPVTGLFFAPNYSSSFADIISRLDYLGKSKLDATAIKDLEGIVFDKDYVHTDNNFTDGYKIKLEGIDANIEDRVNVKISEVTEGLHSLEGNVNSNTSKISANTGNISSLDSRVTTLKSGVDYLTVFTDGLEEELSSHYQSIEDLKTTVNRVDQDAGGAFYMAYTLRGDDIDKSARTIASEEVAKIVAGADSSFDTLKEIADWIHTHPAGVAEINKEILNLKNTKVDKIAQHSLLADSEISRLATLKNYNDSEIRGIINNKVDKKQYYNLVSDSEIAKLATVQTNANYYVLPSDVPHDANYVHTDNNYTTAEKQKLSTLKNYDDTEVRGLINNKVDLTSEQTITGKKLFADNVSPYKTSGRYWTLGESSNPWDKAYVTYLHAPWSGSTFGPQYDNSYDLGTSSRLWRNVYVKGALHDGTNSVSIANISTLNTDQTVDGVKTFNSRPVFSDGIQLSNIYPTIEQSSVIVNGGLFIGGNLCPNTLNVQGYSLGKSLAKWKDLYLSGSIITGDNTEISIDDIASAINTSNNIPSLLNNKVDKVEGKGLSTNDYTDLEKEKVGVVPIPLETSSDIASILTNVVRHINNNYYSNCLYAVNGDLHNIIYAEQINYGPSNAIKFKWWDFKNNIFRKEAGDFITAGSDNISETQIINVDTSSLKTYVDNEIVKVKKQITEIDKIEFKVVSELPTENISTSTVYLLTTDNDFPYAYDEYVYLETEYGGEWELLGKQTFNFSDYVTISDFNSKVQELEDKHTETDKKFGII